MSACEIPPEMLDDDAQLKDKIAQQVTTASAASILGFKAKSPSQTHSEDANSSIEKAFLPFPSENSVAFLDEQ